MMFTVVVPLYNKAKSIGMCIESILKQEMGDFELVVVDDGSTDGGADVVKSFDDARIRLVRKRNGGVSSARNRGVAEARGEWVAFLDGDDVWNRFHLQTLAELHGKYPEAGVLSTDYAALTTDEGLERILSPAPEGGGDGMVKDYYLRLLKGQRVLCSSSVAVRRDCFMEVGGFDERLARGEDMDLWARLYERFVMAVSGKVTAFYRTVIEDVRATERKGDVRRYDVYHFRPGFWKFSYRNMFQYRVIWRYLKHFLVYGQYKNFMLLFMRHNVYLLQIIRYGILARKSGLMF